MSDINKNCPCPYTSCPRHGDCKKCQANHKGGKTSCQKLAEAKGGKKSEKMA